MVQHSRFVRLPALARHARYFAVVLLWVAAMAATEVLAGEAAADGTAKTSNDPALDQAIDKLVKQHGPGTQFSIWLGSPDGKAWHVRNAAAIRPTASAIKAYYLVVLFDRYKDQLDEELPGTAKILGDDNHPAISHFTAEQREEIRRDLKGATVRRVGDVMIGKTKVSNAVYNAAANLVTAVLGGPEALTQSIRNLDPAFQSVSARRYMLRDRTDPGDNEATAAAFAVLYQRLATGRLSGIDGDALSAVRSTLLWEKDPQRGTRYGKAGSLNSDPLTRVRAGWWETAQGPFVYVVMVEQPMRAPVSENQAAEAIRKLTDGLEELTVEAGRSRLP